jgi:hypothetical protein
MTISEVAVKRVRISRDVRRAVFERNPVCVYCEVLPSTVVDHVVPVALGGSSELSNLIGSCTYCNEAKGALPADGRFRFDRRKFGQGWRLLMPHMRQLYVEMFGGQREGIDMPTLMLSLRESA